MLLRRDPQFSQLGNQVLLRPVALHTVAVGAQQLQVLDVILAAGALGDDVFNCQDAERVLAAAAVAPAFLLAEEDVLVLPIRGRHVNVGAPGDVGTSRASRLWNRLPMDCCRRMLTSSTARAELSMPTQPRPKCVVILTVCPGPSGFGNCRA